MNNLYKFKQRIINKYSYRFALGLSCLGVLLAVSCDNDHTKPEVTPTLQEVSFSASSASGKEGITLSDYSTVKLFITTDEAGKAPAHYYVGTTEKTFEAGGTEFTIEDGSISIHLESGTSEGKAYHVQQFDLDADSKTSYRLKEPVSFNLKDTDDTKSVSLALVENKTKVEGETTTEASGKPVSFALSKATSVSDPFFFYIQFQKSGSEDDITYYKGTDKDISDIKFKLTEKISETKEVTYYQTANFFGEISESGKAADKFKVTLPAESRIYKDKKLTISEVSIKIGGSEKTVTVSYYDADNKAAASIQKVGKVTFIPPAITPTVERYVTISDKNFLKYLKAKIPNAFNDKDEMDTDSKLVKTLVKIDLGESGVLKGSERESIASLDEIKYFTGLTLLKCAATKLTRLDISQNTSLTELNCYGSTIENLIIGTNDKLTSLQCSKNNLKSLDLSGCTALKKVQCERNKLTSLNLGNNSSLERLQCNYNYLENLNLNQFKSLISLGCYRNKLTNLDISHLDKLEYLLLHQQYGLSYLAQEYTHTGRPDFVLTNLKIHRSILKGDVINSLRALKGVMTSVNIEVWQNAGDTYSVFCHDYDIVNAQCNDE